MLNDGDRMEACCGRYVDYGHKLGTRHSYFQALD